MRKMKKGFGNWASDVGKGMAKRGHGFMGKRIKK